MPLPALLGFAGETAAQSALFAVIEALLSKLGRGAVKTVGAQALRKVPGFAGKIPAASLSAAGKEALVGAAKSGTVLGAGTTAFNAMLEKLAADSPSGAGGFQEAMAARSFARPTQMVQADAGMEDLLAMLAGRQPAPPQRSFM